MQGENLKLVKQIFTYLITIKIQFCVCVSECARACAHARMRAHTRVSV